MSWLLIELPGGISNLLSETADSVRQILAERLKYDPNDFKVIGIWNNPTQKDGKTVLETQDICKVLMANKVCRYEKTFKNELDAVIEDINRHLTDLQRAKEAIK